MSVQRVGRLAFREEGPNWCAYYAMPDTMVDAIFLGSLSMRIAAQPAQKAAFMTMMRSAVGDIIEEKTGFRPIWKSPVTAPEHERGGNA